MSESGYKEAARAISAGRASAAALWVILSEESQRAGCMLKPMPWEGPGEYQRVTYADGRDGFVRLSDDGTSLPVRRV